jgi:anti-anti-sigma factor
MRITCETDSQLGSVLHCHPVGRLDALGATQFWDFIAGRVGGKTTSVLLDMGNVEFLSSAGVGILIRLLTRVQQEKGALAMYGCTQRVCAVLQVVNVEAILNQRPDEASARRRLQELVGD